MVALQPNRQDRAAFVARQLRIHGPDVVPPAAMEEPKQPSAVSFAAAMSSALSGPRRLVVAGRRITVAEPTVRQLKASLAADATGFAAGDALDRVDAIQRLLVGCVRFDDDPDMAPEAKFAWFDDLGISDSLTVGEAVVDVFDFAAVMQRAQALVGKVKGSASLLKEGAGRPSQSR